MIVLDDTGFAHFGCYGSDAGDAEHRPPRRRRPALHRLPHHRAVLADARRAADRPQPPRRRHARRVELEHRLPAHARRHQPARRDGRRAAARPRLRHLRRRQVAPGADGGVLGRRPAHQLAAAEGLRPLLRVPAGRDRPVPPRADPRQRPHRPAAPVPRTATTSSEDIVDQSIGWIGDLAVGPARPAVLPLPRVRRDARAAPGAARRTSTGGGARSTTATTCARERWFARQLELGIVPPGTTLAPPQPRRAGVGRPHRRTSSAFSCRLQEAFAAMLEHTDAQIGRLVDVPRASAACSTTRC